MTNKELIDAGWTFHAVTGTPGHNWTRAGDRLSYTKPQAEELVAIKIAPPAPRPTCGTCPHWVLIEPFNRAGVCKVAPAMTNHCIDDYCGQHPDMAAWIRDEWPKVKR